MSSGGGSISIEIQNDDNVSCFANKQLGRKSVGSKRNEKCKRIELDRDPKEYYPTLGESISRYLTGLDHGGKAVEWKRIDCNRDPK